MPSNSQQQVSCELNIDVTPRQKVPWESIFGHCTYHFWKRPIQRDFQSFECPLGDFEFHCHSSRVCATFAIGKSSENEGKIR